MPGLLCCSALTPMNWQLGGLSFVLVLCLDFLFLLFLFETGSYTIALTGLKYAAILPQSPKYWDYSLMNVNILFIYLFIYLILDRMLTLTPSCVLYVAAGIELRALCMLGKH